MTPEREAEIRAAPLKSFEVVELLEELDELRKKNKELWMNIWQARRLLGRHIEDPEILGLVGTAFKLLENALK